jgi:hypothetical protein
MSAGVVSNRSQNLISSHSKKSAPKHAINGDEENDIVCGRFPHMDVCACDIQCQIALREINLFEVYPGIVMGPY